LTGATPADAVNKGTPLDVTRPVKADKPIAAGTYEPSRPSPAASRG